MKYLNDNPREWPELLKIKMEEWVREIFSNKNWHLKCVRENTDKMRKEINELKNIDKKEEKS